VPAGTCLHGPASLKIDTSLVLAGVVVCIMCLPAGIYVHGPATCSSCQPAIQARLGSKSGAAEAAEAAGSPAAAAAAAAGNNDSRTVTDPTAAAAAAAADTSHQQQLDWPAADVSNGTAANDQQQLQQQHSGGPKQRHFAPQTRLQQGVLRTNCIDCLDRTNVAQFAYGLAAFGRQLAALGVLGEEEGGVDSDSSIAFQLMEMYEGMGHTIALQVRCPKR
jgi:hypothetical protein